MSTEILQIDVDAAQRRVERMRFHATAMNDSAQSLLKVMHTARELEDHLSLGYASWPALLVDVFGTEPLRLSRQARREVVAEMSDAGMSVRAIAPIVGAGIGTIHRDIEAAHVPNGTPEPAPVEAEGFTVDAATGEIIDGPTLHVPEPVTTEHTITEKVKTITGLDGKEYVQKPREPRPVLTNDDAMQQNAEQACLAIGRSLDALDSLKSDRRRALILDDWWPRSHQDIAPLYTRLFNSSGLRSIAESLNTLAADMEAHNDYV